MRRAALAAAGAALLILAGAPTAGAIPGLPDCKSPPEITSPDTGPAASLDAGPAHPRPGDPFAAHPTTTLYEVDGWGGLTSWPNYDLGCGPDVARDPSASAGGGIATLVMEGNTVVAGGAFALVRMCWSPTLRDLFQPLYGVARDVFGGLYVWALPIVATLAGIYLLVQRRELGAVVSGAAWVLMCVAVGVGALGWAAVVAPKVDAAMFSVVGGLNDAAGQVASDGDPGVDSYLANVHRQVLYETWVRGMFGRSDGPTVEKYAPALFTASTRTREEAAKAAADPAYAQELTDAKTAAYRDVAAKVEAADPEAYSYLAGHHNWERVVTAVLGGIVMCMLLVFVVAASVLIALASVGVILFVVALPALTLLAMIPAFSRFLTVPFNHVAGRVVRAVIFAALCAVLVAFIGALMRAGVTPVWLLFVSALACWLTWRLSKELRAFGVRRGQMYEPGWKTRPVVEPEPAPVSAPRVPAEAMRVAGAAAAGGTAGAAAAVVTVVADRREEPARDAAARPLEEARGPTAPQRSQVGPVPQAVKVYRPVNGEPCPAATYTTPDGQTVHAIYRPTQ